MSHVTEAEAHKQMLRWKKISIAMITFTSCFAVYQLMLHLRHEEDDTPTPQYAYLKIRNKPFPWHYSDCDLLDFDCKRKARAAEEAMQKAEMEEETNETEEEEANETEA